MLDANQIPADAATTTAAATGDQTKTQSLYDISRQYSELEAVLANVEGKIPAEHQSSVEEYFGKLDKERDEKIDAYCAVIRKYENRGNQRAAEAKRLDALAKADLNKAAGLKWLILQFFITHNLDRIETVRNRLVKALNSAAPVKLGKTYEDNPEKLPAKYRTKVYKANLKLIAKELKEGKKFKFASFGDKGENIQIS